MARPAAARPGGTPHPPVPGCDRPARARGLLRCVASLWVVLAAIDGHAQLGPVRIDGVAATIGGHSPGPDVDVVLRSDVELRAALKLLPRTDRPLRLRPPPALLAASLQEIIGEHLIAREAERIRTTPPSARARDAELQRLIATAGGKARVDQLLASLGASPEELRRIAGRRALVAKFLRSNLEGTTAVTEAQVDAVLQGLPATSGERPTRAAVRQRLQRRALDESIAHWVRVLRERIEFSVFVDFGG